MPCVSKSNDAHETLVLCYKSMELDECTRGLHVRTCVDRDLFVNMRQMKDPTGAVHVPLSRRSASVSSRRVSRMSPTLIPS